MDTKNKEATWWQKTKAWFSKNKAIITAAVTSFIAGVAVILGIDIRGNARARRDLAELRATIDKLGRELQVARELGEQLAIRNRELENIVDTQGRELREEARELQSELADRVNAAEHAIADAERGVHGALDDQHRLTETNDRLRAFLVKYGTQD